MLIKNIAQLKSFYGGVQSSMNFDSWKSYLNEAAVKYIEPYIGDELLEELGELVNNATKQDESLAVSATAKQRKLLNLLRISLMAYADYMGMFRQLMSTGDAGKNVPTPPNMQAVSKWLGIGALRSALVRGDDFLEMALKYLERNAADFSVWADSDLFTVRSKFLINSADKFSEFFPACKGSRRMFMTMEKELEKSQNEVRSRLGAVFFDGLIEKNALLIKNEPVDDAAKWAALIKMVGAVISNRAVMNAVPFLNIDGEWHLYSDTDGIDTRELLSAERRMEIAGKMGAEYDKTYAGVLNFLNAEASSVLFEEFFNSTLYVGPNENSNPKIYKNKKENPYAIV